jgi:2-polyprenyl-3-methyl-5-hydroxy-6-metoxy-1,4-benzoquinol methylase
MSSSVKDLYEAHHAFSRRPGFSILKEERGAFFARHIGKGKKILDLGCRDGALTQYFTEGNSVLGVDIDSVALERAVQELNIQTRVLDAHGNWEELKGEKFQVVVAGEVLEHLFYPDQVVEKVSRHLQRRGVFIGSVPNAFSLKNRFRLFFAKKEHTPLSDPTHINHFSEAMLHKLLTTQFSSVTISGLGRYSRLAHWWPNLFAFDLVFVAKN